MGCGQGSHLEGRVRAHILLFKEPQLACIKLITKKSDKQKIKKMITCVSGILVGIHIPAFELKKLEIFLNFWVIKFF